MTGALLRHVRESEPRSRRVPERARRRLRDVYAWVVGDHGPAAWQRRDLVRALVRLGDLTRNELSEETGIVISSVCARVAELLKEGSIGRAGDRVDRITGYRNETLRARRVLLHATTPAAKPKDAKPRQVALEAFQ